MRRLVPAVLLLPLLLASCSQDQAIESASDASAPTTVASPAESPAESPAQSPAESRASTPEESETSSGGGASTTPELLDFAGTTVGGESFDGASLAGRPTVLWFWAPWCPTCRGQIPQVEAIAADHGGDVNVIGIGALDSAEAIAAFAGDVDGVTHLEDVDGELWKRFGVTEQSSFVVLDADGAVSFEAGYGGTDDLAAEVDGLLG